MLPGLQLLWYWLGGKAKPRKEPSEEEEEGEAIGCGWSCAAFRLGLFDIPVQPRHGSGVASEWRKEQEPEEVFSLADHLSWHILTFWSQGLPQAGTDGK